MQKGQRSFLTYLTQNILVLFFLVLVVSLIWVYISTSRDIEKHQRLNIELNNRNSDKAVAFYVRGLFDSLDQTVSIISHSTVQDLDKKHEVLSNIIHTEMSSVLDMVRFFGVDQQQIVKADSPFYELSGVNIKHLGHLEDYFGDPHLLSVQTSKELLWIILIGKRVVHHSSGKVLGTLIGGQIINNNTPLARDLEQLTNADYTVLQIGEQVVCSSKPLPAALHQMAENNNSPIVKTTAQQAEQRLRFVISSHAYLLAHGDSLSVRHFYKDTLQVQTQRTFIVSGVSIIFIAIGVYFLFFLFSRQRIVGAVSQLVDYTNQESTSEQRSDYIPGPFYEFNQVGFAIERMVAELEKSRGELSTERSMLLSLKDVIPDLIFYKNTDSVYIGCNPAFEEFMGKSETELIGTTDHAVFNKEMADFFQKQDQLMMASGKMRINEELVKYPDGRKVMLETVKAPYRGQDGSILGLFGISRDITKLKKTEKQIDRLNGLREELLGLGSLQQKLTHVTEAIVDSFNADFCRIWIVKSGDRCDDDCPHAEVTEGPHVCLHRQNCLHLVASSGRYSDLESYTHGRVPFGCYKIGMIASGEIESFNTNDVVNDPRIHDHEWAQKLGLVSFAGCRLFSDKGGALGVVALFSKHKIDHQEFGLFEGVANSTSLVIQQDIAAKEQETMQVNLLRAQKMEAIGLMAGGVAHDLNNILAGIVGYPELLLMQLPESSELRKPVQAIYDSGKRATVVVKDLLTVARGAASTREPHSINTLIQGYLSSPEYTKLILSHPGVSCRGQLDALNSSISCSSMHIRKTVMNLVTNAAEALADKGNILIVTKNCTIESFGSVEKDLEPGEYVVLVVQDDGAGIAPKDLEHIFEPFYTKKVMGHSGTGLGLAIVWNTVQDHNGRIFVESSAKGTIFRLYFPLSTVKVNTHSEDNIVVDITGKGEHILVVDDEQQLRDIASLVLRELGYKVDVVSSGEQALEFVKENCVDLIVLDMMMDPGMNGRETYEEILKLNPVQKAIVASGFSESKDIQGVLELGAGAFIQKPYSMTKLGKAVREVLKS